MEDEYIVKKREDDEEAEFNDEVYKVCENMQKYGGGFVKKLGMALAHADSNNIMRIKQSFPEYWEEYKNL